MPGDTRCSRGWAILRAAPPILPAISGQLPTTMNPGYKVPSLQKGLSSFPVSWRPWVTNLDIQIKSLLLHNLSELLD